MMSEYQIVLTFYIENKRVETRWKTSRNIEIKISKNDNIFNNMYKNLHQKNFEF